MCQGRERVSWDAMDDRDEASPGSRGCGDLSRIAHRQQPQRRVTRHRLEVPIHGQEGATMGDRGGGNLTIPGRCGDAHCGTRSVQSRRNLVVRAIELEKRKGLQTPLHGPKDGIATEPLQNLLEDQAGENDVRLADEIRQTADGRIAVIASRSQSARPHRCVDQDPHRRLRSAL